MGTRKNDVSVEEALELSALLEKIYKIELKQDRPQAELVEDLKTDKYLRRGPNGRGIPKKKKKPLHWRTRRKKQREVYHSKIKHQRKARKMRLLVTPEGWFKHVIDKWDERGIPHFTLEEWLQVIWPYVDGKVPCFTRYDLNKGFTLHNVLVREDKVGTVLYDGIEQRMRELGYIRDSRQAIPPHR